MSSPLVDAKGISKDLEPSPLSMWKYSVTGVAFLSVLQVMSMFAANSLSFGTSIIEALAVAFSIAWWISRIEKRPLSTTERKRLLFKSSILSAFAVAAIYGLTIKSPNFHQINAIFLSINFLSYPFILYRYTRENRINKFISNKEKKQLNKNSRSLHLDRIRYPIYAQIVFGSAIALLTPNNILNHNWAKTFVDSVFDKFFPKMLMVPSLSSAPEVVVFYHAAMFLSWPIFSAIGIYIIYSAPNYATKGSGTAANKKSSTKSRSSLLLGYAIMLFFALSPFYMLNAGYLNRPLLIIEWLSRGTLVACTLSTWLPSTICAYLFSTAPGVMKIYWNESPWFKNNDKT